MMRILITGASGYVAQFVIKDMVADHELVLFSRRPPTIPFANTHFIAGDLTSPADCVRAAAGVDAIIHLGGINIPAPDTFQVNVLGTYYVLEAARAQGVRRIVFASSNCVFGHCFSSEARAFPVHRFPIDESHPSQVSDIYGLSKRVNEATFAVYARAFGIDSIGLRLAWCWGPAEIKERREEPYRPEQYAAEFWAYVDIRDAARAFRLALAVASTSSPTMRVYNISAADTTAEAPSVQMIERFFPQYRELAKQLQGYQSFFSWQAAHNDLGYEPQYTWR